MKLRFSDFKDFQFSKTAITNVFGSLLDGRTYNITFPQIDDRIKLVNLEAKIFQYQNNPHFTFRVDTVNSAIKALDEFRVELLNFNIEAELIYCDGREGERHICQSSPFLYLVGHDLHVFSYKGQLALCSNSNELEFIGSSDDVRAFIFYPWTNSGELPEINLKGQNEAYLNAELV